MRKLCFLLSLFLLLNSCATVLNKKTTKVKIHAPHGTKVSLNGKTHFVKNESIKIFPKRSKDSLRLIVSNDSISNNFALRKKTSGTIALNLFLPYTFGAGFLVDLTNHKRFTYKKNLYFDIDSINNRFYMPRKKPLLFKKNDVFIYTTPLKAIDIFSQPMLTIGAEYFFTNKMSFSAEYGTVYTKRLGSGRNPKLQLVEDKGRAFRYELKYYNLISISNNPRVNEYIGVEARFLRYQFNDDIRFSRKIDDIRYTVDETLVVQKSIDIFNIKYGLNYPIGKRLYIDLYSGFGIRIRTLKNPNRNYNPDTDFLLDEDSHYDFRRNNIEGINEGNDFNFSLGFKFGYKF
ncbi:hypothetical protein [Winogradskyella luteola]|uniref:Outer membrane protein beta-barrel domain-containing protein n=1 Tax=Winogradskyella luteola TaxID=2828330 RepID=A0A9X1F6R6_9FLAO|nr:hypothetical protein [Winogradskyella luteola]MBV7268189.1 hypothetical protein [Winogradskyella luteola]